MSDATIRAAILKPFEATILEPAVILKPLEEAASEPFEGAVILESVKSVIMEPFVSVEHYSALWRPQGGSIERGLLTSTSPQLSVQSVDMAGVAGTISWPPGYGVRPPIQRDGHAEMKQK